MGAVGGGVRIAFTPTTPGPSTVGLGDVQEGRFVDGKWTVVRQLGGDDTGQGEDVYKRQMVYLPVDYRAIVGVEPSHVLSRLADLRPQFVLVDRDPALIDVAEQKVGHLVKQCEDVSVHPVMPAAQTDDGSPIIEEPVSYTHLDVYKRQVVDGSRR